MYALKAEGIYYFLDTGRSPLMKVDGIHNASFGPRLTSLRPRKTESKQRQQPKAHLPKGGSASPLRMALRLVDGCVLADNVAPERGLGAPAGTEGYCLWVTASRVEKSCQQSAGFHL